MFSKYVKRCTLFKPNYGTIRRLEKAVSIHSDMKLPRRKIFTFVLCKGVTECFILK